MQWCCAWYIRLFEINHDRLVLSCVGQQLQSYWCIVLGLFPAADGI